TAGALPGRAAGQPPRPVSARPRRRGEDPAHRRGAVAPGPRRVAVHRRPAQLSPLPRRPSGGAALSLLAALAGAAASGGPAAPAAARLSAEQRLPVLPADRRELRPARALAHAAPSHRRLP